MFHPQLRYLYLGRWRHIAATYAELGILPTGFSHEEFLDNPNPEPDLAWLYLPLSARGILLLLVSGITLDILHRNWRLVASEERYRDVYEIAPWPFWYVSRSVES